MVYALYLLSVLGSGLGFMTQMLVSGYWTTAYSQDVFHFSINLAFYFLALGIGSLLSNQWKLPTMGGLINLVLALSLVTGSSISFLKFGIGLWGNQIWLPLCVVVAAGILSGMVIPLTLRVGEGRGSLSLATLFFIDYSAAMIFTLLFTLVLLIPLGYSKTAMAIAASSLLTVVLSALFLREISFRKLIYLLICGGIPTLAFYLSQSHVAPRMDNSGIAKILHSEQSHYQKIVLTEEVANDPFLSAATQHVLYLDGFVQFSSLDEQNYHVCLVNIPLAAAEFDSNSVRKVLILGGGDGLAARNFLTNPKIEKVTMVELDPAMIRLGLNHPVVRMYNVDSLKNPRMEIKIEDAFRWVRETHERYDLIVIDFPAPKNLTLARLFSAEFYSAAFKLLNPKGFVSIQAGPSFSFEDQSRITLSKVTASIIKTIESIGYRAFPYVTPQDSEAFVLATNSTKFDMTAFSTKIGILSTGNLGIVCRYDPKWKFPKVEVNTLNTLKLSNYMLEWFKRAGLPFFYYRGSHLVFLPE